MSCPTSNSLEITGSEWDAIQSRPSEIDNDHRQDSSNQIDSEGYDQMINEAHQHFDFADDEPPFVTKAPGDRHRHTKVSLALENGDYPHDWTRSKKYLTTCRFWNHNCSFMTIDVNGI